jgi:hypothetical protein
MISIDLGYYDTPSGTYQDGLIYGLSVTEGTGKLGFGVTAWRFSNTHPGVIVVDGPDGKPHETEFEESVSDFYITFLAVYRLKPAGKNQLMLAGGPQVHFLNSTLQVGELSWGARDFRLGMGAMVRYQRRIEMFGKTAFVLAGTYSHMQSVSSRTDQYEVPTASVNIGTVTAGLAFPF